MIDFTYDPIIGLKFWCIQPPTKYNKKTVEFDIPSSIWNEINMEHRNIVQINRKILKPNKLNKI